MSECIPLLQINSHLLLLLFVVSCLNSTYKKTRTKDEEFCLEPEATLTTDTLARYSLKHSRQCHHCSSMQPEASTSKWDLHENTRGNWKASMAQSWLTPRYSLSVGNLQVIFAQKMDSSKPREEGVAFQLISERWRDESVAAFHSLQVVPPQPSQQSHPTQTCCSPEPFVSSPGQALKQPKKTNLKKSNLLRMLHLTGNVHSLKVSDRLIVPTTWTWLTTQRLYKPLFLHQLNNPTPAESPL